RNGSSPGSRCLLQSYPAETRHHDRHGPQAVTEGDAAADDAAAVAAPGAAVGQPHDAARQPALQRDARIGGQAQGAEVSTRFAPWRTAILQPNVEHPVVSRGDADGVAPPGGLGTRP